MKIYFILFFTVLLFSCENKHSVAFKCEKLAITTDSLWVELGDRNKAVHNLYSIIDEYRLKDSIRLLGREPLYLVVFKLKQDHLTLDLWEHAKDAMNTVEFEVAVSEKQYNSLSVGDDLVNEPRIGSMIINNSYGNWVIRVTKKYIE